MAQVAQRRLLAAVLRAVLVDPLDGLAVVVGHLVDVAGGDRLVTDLRRDAGVELGAGDTAPGQEDDGQDSESTHGPHGPIEHRRGLNPRVGPAPATAGAACSGPAGGVDAAPPPPPPPRPPPGPARPAARSARAGAASAPPPPGRPASRTSARQSAGRCAAARRYADRTAARSPASPSSSCTSSTPSSVVANRWNSARTSSSRAGSPSSCGSVSRATPAATASSRASQPFSATVLRCGGRHRAAARTHGAPQESASGGDAAQELDWPARYAAQLTAPVSVSRWSSRECERAHEELAVAPSAR